jgi:hypothetical protein
MDSQSQEDSFSDRMEGLTSPTSPDRVAIIRTSDRLSFRRCRRKFNWWYVHRGNLTRRESPDYFWFGTGFHFALEDYHGYRRFPSPSEAFAAFVDACKRTPAFPIPQNIDELEELGLGMMSYYEEWLLTRDPLITLEVGGVPQVEVNFQIDIPLDPGLLNEYGFDRAVYTGTIDRVVVDEYGRLWLGDYKTARAIQTSHLDTDPQISAYCWAAQHIYNMPVAGFFYMQFKKVVPHQPAFLKSTGTFSVAKNQVTTHALYRRALVNMYESVERAPTPNIQFLEYLEGQESERADSLIAFDSIERSQNQIEAEGLKILQETAEMLNPNLPMYPNPTRDCSWDCGYKTACVLMDLGLDYEHELELTTIDREEEQTQWRRRIKYPETPHPLPRLSRLRPKHRLKLPPL